MDRDRNRDGELDRANRENQVPGVRRDDPSQDRSMQGRPTEDASDRSMQGRPREEGTSDRSTSDVSGSPARDGDALQGGGPDRGGILNDHREGTTRNQTGSNVRDEHSRPTGSPADGA